MIKGSYTIQPIGYRAAMDLIVEKHYLHRRAPCSFAFVLINTDGIICGVITYGTPSSSSLREGIFGKEFSNEVIELTRLWVDDTVPKNGESFLIGNTLRKVDKKIIVSYAELEQGHIGTVYQATNFIYTGLSAKRTNWTVSGINKHCQTLADKYTASEIREKFGSRFSLVDRPRKHRYIFLNCRKSERKNILSKLKYDISPYPKAAK